jgi:hypothetical protein
MAAPTAERRIFATFHPQQWINDYAVDSGDVIKFDVTDAVNRMSAAQRSLLRDNSDEADQLIVDAINAGTVEGPAGGYVNVESAIKEYDEDEQKYDPDDLAELPTTYIGRRMDADLWTLEAWDEYVTIAPVEASETGAVPTEVLSDFEANLFGAYTSEYELEEAWDNWSTADSQSLEESLDVRKIEHGVAAFWY